MTAPGFRVLTKEELAKLTLDERHEYTRQLIEHVRHQTADIEKSLKARHERFKKPE